MEDLILAIIGIAFMLFLFRLDFKSYEKQEIKDHTRPNKYKYDQDNIQQAIKDSKYRDFENYKAYLSSDQWKMKRARRMLKDQFKCQDCKCDVYKSTAHVHHINYDTLYNEDINSLVTLCKQCHDVRHNK